MIRIDFNPDEIPGSLPLTANDLKDAGTLIGKLRGEDRFSEYLLQQFSPETRQLLTSYDGASPVPQPVVNALLNDLNSALSGPTPFDKRVLRGIELERATLIKGLLDTELGVDDVPKLNRMVLEDVYTSELNQSPKAEWEAWIVLAREATNDVITQWETWKKSPGAAADFVPKFEDYIWKGIRNFLLKYVFYGKCAYCETREVGYISDAEHFRPKGQVRTQQGIVKTLDIDGLSEITHPGYFWLAYHWQNLLPSCNTCNRYDGKKDSFPVKNRHIAVTRITDQTEIDRLMNKLKRSQTEKDLFYLEPEALDIIEDRLLLHPYFDLPEKDIYFQLDGTAVARPGSLRGQASIEVYALNQRNKVSERNRIQTDDVERYIRRVTAVIPDLNQMKSVARQLKNEYYKGERPYGAAVFDSIRHWVGSSPLDPEQLLKP